MKLKIILILLVVICTGLPSLSQDGLLPLAPAPQPVELSPALPPAAQELVDSVNDAINEPDPTLCTLDCDDGNPCTEDTCEVVGDGEICVTTPIDCPPVIDQPTSRVF